MKTKHILILALILSVIFTYKSEFLLFNILETIDTSTNHKFKLIGVRNKFLHSMNALNPFIGKMQLQSQLLDTISIELTKKDLNKLEKTYNDIIEDKKDTGINYIHGDMNPYVKCKIIYKGKKYKAKIRFHGTASGHVDHLKKSFAIKMNKENLLDNMRRFSIVIPEKQKPVSFLFEYDLIEWFTGFKTDTRLVAVNMNGVDQGFYVLEEKIAKELLEKNNFSGVDIIKSKNAWDNQYAGRNLFYDELSYLDVKYNSNKNVGQLLKWDKIYSLKDFNELKIHLNIDSFVKNDALRVLLFDLHGYVNYNQKLLYSIYNGKISAISRFESRLLPIIIDENTRFWFDKSLSGITGHGTNTLLNTLIQNDEYREKRNTYLLKLIKNKALILKKFDEVFNKVKPIILADNTNQAPGQQFIYISKKRRGILSANFDLIEKYLYYNKVYTNLRRINNTKYVLEISPDSNSPVKIIDINISNSYPINIRNVKNNDIVQVASKNDLISFFSDKKFILGMDDKMNPKKNIYKYEILVLDNRSINNFNISYENTLTKRKVEKRDNYSLLIDDTKNLSVDDFLNTSFFPLSHNSKTKTLTLESGIHIIKENIVLPYGYTLIIKQGTKLKIAPNASIVVYGGLSIKGTKQNPVIIENLIKGKPFGVIGAIGDNKTNINIDYLNISGAKDTTINGAYLSGGLSLYDHNNIKITNSHIHHNSADDGLNIKNSNVLLDNNIFNSNLADQVDLDVCIGIVKNNKFLENIPNSKYNNVKIPQDDNGDGLDFSGSKMIVENNYYNGFPDKGISIGEKTKVILINNEFVNNRSAITVKDESDIFVYNNKYNNNKINIEMYQKKQIFNHPSAYNINEKHNKNKIKKTKESHYYKSESLIDMKDINISIIFDNLKMKKWVEYE